MSDYKALVADLRDADQANWKRLSLDAAAAIEALQAQLPKRGEWVRKESENTYWFECSECGGYPMRDTWDGEGKLTDFCPRCGADMRKMWEVQNADN